ncbi:hypothetical protein KFE25_002432 [Diacronema lutheri]|uniref:Hydroxyproline O-arabinosyltransferase-like domain-containing protein n=1 Tax=Diacronema lutheri TaxID=2081491 RepID=A0A8J6CB95_DIALT|nr:hypothetical protein KFE25_002432 [Diacronema lutheri]
MVSGRTFVALLLAALMAAVLTSSVLFTRGSLQHAESAHIVESTIVARGDSRQLYNSAARVAAAAAAAAGEGEGGMAESALESALELATASAVASARGAGGECGRTLRPYHVLITSSSGVYQAWQTRVMYYHVVKQKRAEGTCSEIGGITRLLTMPGGRADDLMMAIPTYVVRELLPGREDHGFVVMNRPHSVKAFVEDRVAFARLVSEEYIMIAETDHVWLRPLRNLATPTEPYAFHFGYMEAHFRAPLVERFCAGASKTMDPVGPSPLVIHIEQLRALVGPWLAMSHRLKMDADADQQLGWVLEMWGYAIAAACAGVKHTVSAEFQFEGGSIGSHERRMEVFRIFHYTYGIEYSVSGVPMELQVGHWSLDKRHYGGSYPPRGLSAPPRCAEERARLLSGAFNEASAQIDGWPGGAPDASASRLRGRAAVGPDTWRVRPEDAPLPTSALASSELARRVLGTGPWRWSGPGCCGGHGRSEEASAVSIFFMRDGLVYSEIGSGAWAVEPAARAARAAGAGADADAQPLALLVTFVGVTSRLTFQLPDGDGSAAWTFEAVPLGHGASTGFGAGPVVAPERRHHALAGDTAPRGRGELQAPRGVLRRWAAPVPPPPADVGPARGEAEQRHHGARLEGSGFFRTWGCLLRAGVAWRGRYASDVWQLWQLAHDGGGGGGGGGAGGGAGSGESGDGSGGARREWGSGVVLRVRPLADSEHVPTLPYAPARGGDGGSASGTQLPPSLVFSSCWAFTEEGKPARRHEWLIPKPAQQVMPGCAAAELPRLGRFLNLPADALAQRLLASGTWAWAGVEGMRFLAEGVLVTPWGSGLWGVVPGQPRLIWASFAQQLHMLNFGAQAAAEGVPLARFQSTRCSDGETVQGSIATGKQRR